MITNIRKQNAFFFFKSISDNLFGKINTLAQLQVNILK